MALLAKTELNLIVCIQRDVIVIDSQTNEYTKINIPLPVKKPKSDGESEDPGYADDQESSDSEKKNGKQRSESHQINLAAVSPSGKLIAVTTLGDKFLTVLRICPTNGVTILSKRPLYRVASSIRFSPDSKLVIVADKTGICYAYNAERNSALQIQEADDHGKKLFGHLSIVLDILMTPNQDFVITCDRDEKIRVSRYPATHVIESYCLGHSEYVSGIEVIGETNLVSVSGDKTIRLWNFKTGDELFQQQLDAPAYKCAINASNHLAVVLLKTPISIGFFSIINDDSPKIISLGEQALSSDFKTVTSVVFNDTNILLVSGVKDNDESLTQSLCLNDTGNCSGELSQLLSKLLAGIKIEQVPDLSILFKKRFDNLKDYHERKKRRIEEKSQDN